MTALHYSFLTDWTCPQYGHYKHLRRISPKDARDFTTPGSAIHAALATYAINGDPERAIASAKAIYGDPSLLTEEWVAWDVIELAIKNYITNNPDLPNDLAYITIPGSYDAIPAVELELEAKLPPVNGAGYGYQYGGVIDLIYKDTVSGDLVLRDYKCTTQALTPYFGDRFINSYQLKGYMCLARLNGIPVDRAEIQGIYMGSSRSWEPGQSQIYTIMEYWDPAHLNSQAAWVDAVLTELVWRMDRGLTRQIEGAMFRQNVCRRCDYRLLCESMPDEIEGLIDMHYDRRVSNAPSEVQPSDIRQAGFDLVSQQGT